MKKTLKVLAVDIGGTNVKILATGQTEPRKFPSGKTLTPRKMVAGVKQLAKDWQYDVVSIGYPGQVVADRATTEPRNLAQGWVGFDFAAAFGRPVKVMNDAAMQALGSYEGGTMLFLGLGTGLGSALMVRGHIVPMELGALSYRNGAIEDYLGARGLKKARQEEVAQDRRVRRETVHLRASPRRRRHRRRKRQEAEEGAPRLPARRQRQRVPWRVPNVGAVDESHASGFPRASRRPGKESERITHMKKTNSSLTARPAWKALVAHHKKIRDVHLRQALRRRSQRAASV